MSEDFMIERRRERRKDPRDKRDTMLKEMRRHRAREEEEAARIAETREARKNSRKEGGGCASSSLGVDPHKVAKWQNARVQAPHQQRWRKGCDSEDDSSEHPPREYHHRDFAYRKSRYEEDDEDEDEDEDEEYEDDDEEDEAEIEEDEEEEEEVKSCASHRSEKKCAPTKSKPQSKAKDDENEDEDEEFSDDELDPDLQRRVKFLLSEHKDNADDDDAEIDDADETASVASVSSRASHASRKKGKDEEAAQTAKSKKQLEKEFKKERTKTIQRIQELEHSIQRGSAKQKHTARKELREVMERFAKLEKAHFYAMNPHLRQFSSDEEEEEEAAREARRCHGRPKQRSASANLADARSCRERSLSERAKQALESGEDPGYVELLESLRQASENVGNKSFSLDEFSQISKRINLYTFEIEESYFHLPPGKRSPPEPIVPAVEFFRRDYYPNIQKVNKVVMKDFGGRSDEDRLYYIRRSKIDKVRYEVQMLEYKYLQAKRH